MGTAPQGSAAHDILYPYILYIMYVCVYIYMHTICTYI